MSSVFFWDTSNENWSAMKYSFGLCLVVAIVGFGTVLAKLGPNGCMRGHERVKEKCVYKRLKQGVSTSHNFKIKVSKIQISFGKLWGDNL